MKVPLNWLTDYIKLNHTPEEFGKIMTDLEFMQDGPIVEINGQKVIEIEVRQNRPDLLSIIGVAREYAAYIDSNITEPKKLENTEIKVEWGSPDQNLKVDEPEIVKRFCTVELSNVKIKPSPDWLRNNLEAYGINTINNVVDITNYVMLEYGMPLHAFDFNKLAKKDGSPLLTLRLATNGEEFKTWQNTVLKLSEDDLVVSDNEKPVALAGIIGGANSDIDEQTSHIILESACYNQAVIRKSSQKHGIRTEASSRHEKFLNPSMVTAAILRALFLLTDLAEAKIIAIEDHNLNENQEKKIVEFNTNE
ncbi:MAG: Phenylalanine--tRNA ligase beta subunit, partial [Patescibacteria group bacterium]|nr:Phenylalanine--tRNA ligase beta subunit [Patescibacteria group bacterium]